MNIVVTGGAGFIGSFVVDQLIELGHGVTVIDNLDPAAHLSPPNYLHPEARYLTRDVRDQSVWAEVLDSADGIAHLAGKVGLGVDFGDAAAYVDNNDVGTVQLLSALHHSSWRGKLVLASSMVVYGEGRYSCATHGDVPAGVRDPKAMAQGDYEPPCPACGVPLTPELIDESRPLRPRNVYAATKLHQEHLWEAFGHEHNMATVALRFHNVYGPRMPKDTPYAGVAAIFLSALAAGRAPQVFEDGGQLRDFVFVTDVAASVCAALVGKDEVSGAFNVASGEPRSVLHMAQALAEEVNPDLVPQVVGGFRDGDIRHVLASPQKLWDTFGIAPEVSFREGLAMLASAPLR